MVLRLLEFKSRSEGSPSRLVCTVVSAARVPKSKASFAVLNLNTE
jgi:hypothetical protein